MRACFRFGAYRDEVPEDDRYRDVDPTRQMPIPGKPVPVQGHRGDGTIRDNITGRPTAPRFVRDARDASPPASAAAAAPTATPGSSRSATSAARSARSRSATPDPDDTRLGRAFDSYDSHDVPSGRAPSRADRGPAPGAPSRPTARPARRGRRPLRLLRTILVLLLIIGIGYPFSLGGVAWRNVTKTDALPTVTDTAGTTYLLVGSDSREGLTEADVGYLNSGSEADAAGKRTDTILLLHVPGGGQQPVLISIPRDSYVSIPGNGQNKINAAFAFGGPALLAQTITDATGIGIDSYVETGLGGFARITDAIGGVETCLPAPITDPDAGIDLAAGCQTLNGAQALGLARSRKTDAQGDLARVARQRAILSAIVTQAASPATVLNPFTGYRVAAAGGSALTVDADTGPIDLGRFLLGMRSIAGGGGITMTVPVSNLNLSTPAGSAVEWDPVASQQLWSALLADDMATVAALAAAQEPAVEVPTAPGSVPSLPPAP